jgi:anti-sigma regulatory factor (Ser/Thr protein kinase)
LKVMTIDNGAAYGAHVCPSEADGSRQLYMTLPAVSHSVRLSRYATRAVLTAWQLAHVDEAATLLVSELVTNAVRHARGIDVVTVNLHARANLAADRGPGHRPALAATAHPRQA